MMVLRFFVWTMPLSVFWLDVHSQLRSPSGSHKSEICTERLGTLNSLPVGSVGHGGRWRSCFPFFPPRTDLRLHAPSLS